MSPTAKRETSVYTHNRTKIQAHKEETGEREKWRTKISEGTTK
jgi:hypothetical protein